MLRLFETQYRTIRHCQKKALAGGGHGVEDGRGCQGVFGEHLTAIGIQAVGSVVAAAEDYQIVEENVNRLADATERAMMFRGPWARRFRSFRRNAI